MSADATGTIRSRIKNLLRSPSIKLRRSSAARSRDGLGQKVTLEKVLGITAPGNRALACDPQTGLLAYPAGCVVVLLNPRRNKQSYIFNCSRKAITTLAFSPDSKYVVTGESGHMPAVRVWEVSARTQVAELQEHKYGVSCVAFSPNGKYVVSVGYQHDMMVNVWNWKKNVVVAANKVSSKVTAVSFSDDSSYFVTAGNRHVKFWYLDHSKTSKVNATVPLLGRSGLLGELRNNFFSDVACGRGRLAASTFCITSSGLLCEFNERRLLDKWVELRNADSAPVRQATCLCVTDDFIFCGCSDGTVRAFSPVDLHFLCTLPRPHHLGADVGGFTEASQLFSCRPDARFPDTLALTYDPANRWLSCVYDDHSVYVWDLRELGTSRRAGKLYSALYHSSCVWSVEVCPEGGAAAGFLTCSSDSTIRLWSLDNSGALHRNILSQDLRWVIYVDDSTSSLVEPELAPGGSAAEALQGEQGRSGVRTLRVSPDGRHLASGDRGGVLRIHSLDSLEEILNVQAHDSELLCLEFSQPDTGLRLLATASRDRLIHVLDASADYSLLQTLDEHSSSITAVRFAAHEGHTRMISCGADKSVYFRSAQQSADALHFTRTHHVVRKTTLYDMDVEATRKYAAVGCQDRRIRIFNISSGKQKKMYKGSQGEDGTLIKVQCDPSGLYIATSCSDKNISIFDFYSGECVATMFGHSEIVTGLKFSNDCRHLISVSGDSCIFVWRLSPDLTLRMRQRLSDLRPSRGSLHSEKKLQRPPADLSRAAPPPQEVNLSSDSEKEDDGEEEEDKVTGGGGDSAQARPDVRGSGKEATKSRRLPRRRWSKRSGDALMVKSMLDLRLLDSYDCNGLEEEEEEEEGGGGDTRPLVGGCSAQAALQRSSQERGSTFSLQVTPVWVAEETTANRSPDREEPVLFPGQWEDSVSLAGSEFQVTEASPEEQDKPSPDSGCSLEPLGGGKQPTQPEWCGVDQWVLSADLNSSDPEEEEEGRGVVPQTPDQEAFLKEHFVKLADLSASGRTSQSSSENLSMSSRFLSRNCTASRPPEGAAVDPGAGSSRTKADCGLRKARSVQSLPSAAGEAPPRRPTTLPSAPRRLLSSGPPPLQPSPASPKSDVKEAMAARKWSGPAPAAATASRSYMSPTASSKAKMSRSVSMGDGLNESPEEAVGGACPVVPLVAAPPPHAAVVPVVLARGLQARAPGRPAKAATPEEVTPDACRELSAQLRTCFKRATHLYRKVRGSCPADSAPEQRQMARLLSDVFRDMRAELDSLPLDPLPLDRPGEEGPLPGGAKTAALLEEYSLLLLQAVTRKSAGIHGNSPTTSV
ncbi:mitogen-activated protein kinase-binding protein 1 isoform X1 [Synchiropus splendidus]|uniref:mitogen-activated protein kinase-binding protein 1 isoform X1 n=1 Tax=Synchiropus splendidus TaxID=270530 RepID=UPI00237E76A0|nr:mitogen-activated protein kinase-binding protein 1 isoform X1 [Synchiropus splendidus]